MNLDEASALREHLDAIDALMRGVLEKAERLPTVDQLDDLAQQVAFISAHLDNAVEQARKLAAAPGAVSDEPVIVVPGRPRP
jgi:hypothetical protein